MRKGAFLALLALLFGALAGTLAGCTKEEQAVELNISAAGSLVDVLTEINNLYKETDPNVTITPNFAASGTLQTQIEQGAPCDVFISAGAKQMDNLQNQGVILEDTRSDLLNNKIVLIMPGDSTLGLTSFAGLTSPGVGKVAIGDPASVPAGSYGKNALEQLGIYAQVQSKLILCPDVRTVLTYVENGDVDAGIVYATDAMTSRKVHVIAEGPPEISRTMVYPVAVIKASDHVDAATKYIDFLSGSEARAVFEKYGFVMVED